MTTKAIITRRGILRPDAVTASESAEAKNLGLTVEHRLPQGILVQGDEKQYAALEAQGYRLKLLTDTNILKIGPYRIDTESSPPKVPPELEVPRSQQKTWTHYLIQLAAPPTEEWIRAIEEQGVEVVEPISAYGLFVVADPDDAASLKELPFVAWVGPFQPAYRISADLLNRKGRIQFVNIGIYPQEEVEDVIQAIQTAGGVVVEDWGERGSHRGGYQTLIADMDDKAVRQVACRPGVRWLEYHSPVLIPDGERACQIVAEKTDGVAPPFTGVVAGYQDLLNELDLSGAGVVVGICDTGVCNNVDDATMHPDLQGRMAFFVDRTGGQTLVDGWMNAQGVIGGGHGTAVAGCAVGNATSGEMDSGGFLLGQGMAPGASFGILNALAQEAGSQPTADLTELMVQHGANVMNNSWSLGNVAGYAPSAALLDRLARDPDANAAGLEKLTLVFSGGNDGPQPNTISEPHEAKNIIVVGSSENALMMRGAGIIVNVSDSSSRGPAEDGRYLPNLVAPGTFVVSTRSSADADSNTAGLQQPGVPFTDPLSGDLHSQYDRRSGTSFAAPHVSGLCALLIEWWRKHRNGETPSAALLKALLINGAEDMAGERWHRIVGWAGQSPGISRKDDLGFAPVAVTYVNSPPLTQVNQLADLTPHESQWFYDAADDTLYVGSNLGPGSFVWVHDMQDAPNIPNNDQGWGRVSLPNIVQQTPDSDRGPKIFSDQRHAFTANGQEYLIRVAAVDPALPLRITLVWTDAPGAPGANPALVNDLDLEVTETSSGNVYKGNVFENGFSVTGDDFDNLNNIECVYVRIPTGIYEVRVVAAVLRANALPPYDLNNPWQDFALVIDNAEVPASAPVSVVPVIDRSGSMVASGYVDITKISSKQFVDLMRITDNLGVVSFGSTSAVEYPTGSAPTFQGIEVQAITGQSIRDAASGRIDGIDFGGCTFMGAGINEARNLLNKAAGSRAIVLLSDGYDNKGCQNRNPLRPSALDAVRGLPANMPVYTCAMGPASDQGLLAQIADTSDGRYYYMPAIDDLFEIYNYIRFRITQDATQVAIVANESAMASSSRVAAFVDALATEATFTVAWADTRLHFVAGDPKNSAEVSIRLREPRGRLLHPSDSYVRRIVGEGYVAFNLQEPMPGQWYVEVTTAAETHIRYTVGGFVRSPLRLVVTLNPKRPITGFNIATQMFDGERQISGFKASAQVIYPNLGIPDLLKKYKTQLHEITPGNLPGGDTLPADIAKLMALRAKILQAEKTDIFAHSISRVPLRNATMDDLIRLKFGQLVTPEEKPIASTTRSGTLVGQFKDTKHQGSYNVLVTASGMSPVSGTRFVRKEMVSRFVK